MTILRYAWEPYLKYGKEIKFKKNAYIFRQAEPGKGFYYIKNGGVKIAILSNQYEERIIELVPAGFLFGVHGIKKEPYLTTAIATSCSDCYYFSDEALLKIYSEHPESAVIYMKSVIAYVRLLSGVIYHFGTTIEQCMASALLQLSESHQTDSLPIDQTTLAHYIGKTRVSVNKVIQTWKKDKLIDNSAKGIQIIDFERLRKIGKKPSPLPE